MTPRRNSARFQPAGEHLTQIAPGCGG
jgi:hypothetical protein